MHKSIRGSELWVGVLLIVLCLQTVLAQSTLEEYPVLTVTFTDEGLEMPDSVEAGYYRLEFDNQSSVQGGEGPEGPPPPEVALDRLKEGAEVDEILRRYEAVNRSIMGEGNPAETIPQLTELITGVGGSTMPENAVFQLAPGEYMASVAGEDIVYQTFTVTETSDQVQEPQADLVVDMLEFAFTIPDEVEAGEQTWEIRNVGDQVHHLILFRIQDDKSMEDVMTFLETEQGQPPLDEVGYTAILSPGVSNYVGYDLEPGAYLALCFLPDYETGQPHVMLGMMDDFTVNAD